MAFVKIASTSRCHFSTPVTAGMSLAAASKKASTLQEVSSRCLPLAELDMERFR